MNSICKSNWNRILLIVILLGAPPLIATGCGSSEEKESRLGEEMKEVGEELGEAADAAKDTIEDEVEDLGDKIEDATDKE